MLTDHKVEGTDRILQLAIANDGSIVFTDESTSYMIIADYTDIHINKESTERKQKKP